MDIDHKIIYDTLVEKYSEVLQATKQGYIDITVDEATNLSSLNSKFFGKPYLPIGAEYPKTLSGEYLYLLAQINFSEIPKLDPFPESGLIQFWIAGDESLGLDFDSYDNDKGWYKVIYYPEVTENNLVQDFSFLPLPELYGLPLDISKSDYHKEYKNIMQYGYSISFTKKEMITTIDSMEFEGIQDPVLSKLWDAFFYNDHYEKVSKGSRMGGYPLFRQGDPRVLWNEEERKEVDFLLLQIDSDTNGSNKISFGDGGVANFFIGKDKLLNKDFSDVTYNWDCY